MVLAMRSTARIREAGIVSGTMTMSGAADVPLDGSGIDADGHGLGYLPAVNSVGHSRSNYDRNSPVDIFCRVGDHWEGDVVHADGRSRPIGGI